MIYNPTIPTFQPHQVPACSTPPPAIAQTNEGVDSSLVTSSDNEDIAWPLAMPLLHERLRLLAVHTLHRSLRQWDEHSNDNNLTTARLSRVWVQVVMFNYQFKGGLKKEE